MIKKVVTNFFSHLTEVISVITLIIDDLDPKFCE